MKNFIRKIVPKKIRIKIYSIINFLVKVVKIIWGWKKNIHYVSPNCLYRGRFNNTNIIVDVGCGSDADFSVYMIRKYGLKSIAIDPTIKHQKKLLKIKEENKGLFDHLPIAISCEDGEITFNESIENMSGSILKSHRNIENRDIRQYAVKSASLKNLPTILKIKNIQYIKLDMEGAEYELIDNLTEKDVVNYDQIFIEFHDYCIPERSKKDTFACRNKMEKLGFKYYSVDNINFLFYR